jgi:hypothetical protein
MLRCALGTDPLAQNRDDPFSAAAVPEIGHAPVLSPAGEDFIDAHQQLFVITAQQQICAHIDSHRAFRILSHGKARHTKPRRLLLDAARVSYYSSRVSQQLQEVEVSEWLAHDERAYLH